MVLFIEDDSGSIHNEVLKKVLSLKKSDLSKEDNKDLVYKNYINGDSKDEISDYYYPNSIKRTQKINIEDIINTNRELIKIYLNSKIAEGKSISTIEQYLTTLESLFFKIIKPIDEINTQDIRNYLLNYKNERIISNNSLDNERRKLNAFFNFLEDENYILKSPMNKIKKIKGEKIIKKPFNEEEVEMLRDACVNIRELAIIDFLDSSGVRLSECVALDKENIDLENREGVVIGKGNKQRIIYFSSRCKVHLQNYLNKRNDNNKALFVVDNFPYSRLSKRGLEFLVKEIGNRAGVENCYPHRFRRTVATRLIYKGVPIEQVQRLLGHSKIETTLIYAEVNQEEVKNNHRKYI